MSSRRKFLKIAGGIVGVTAGGGQMAACNDRGRNGQSKTAFRRSDEGSAVVVARDKSVFTGDTVDRDVVRRMIGSSLKKLTGVSTETDAWRTIISPDDTVGIKVNCLGGPKMCTRPELVDALIESLTKSAGIPSNRIIIWDRFNRELDRCGYKLASTGSGPLCFGTDDRRAGYESDPRIYGSIGSCFSTILTRLCTAIINVPILKDHDLAGVSIGMKNFFGVIHNPNKYHDNCCDPYVADLNTAQPIRSKLRLTVCDAITPQYHGGPAYKKQFVWPFAGILMARDPVALDATGARIIETERKTQGKPTLAEQQRDPAYIRTAESKGLGWAREDKVRVLEV